MTFSDWMTWIGLVVNGFGLGVLASHWYYGRDLKSLRVDSDRRTRELDALKIEIAMGMRGYRSTEMMQRGAKE